MATELTVKTPYGRGVIEVKAGETVLRFSGPKAVDALHWAVAMPSDVELAEAVDGPKQT